MGKLVRDKIPEIIEASGRTPLFYETSGHNYWEFLIDKLLEEAREASEHTPYKKGRAGIESELADVLEVLYALCDNLDVPFASIQEARLQKKMERGGFSKGYILTGVE
jgi:predicted house-cleaning noncanonical NTP pyrophosphatase (MazG superfamily)